MCGRYFRDTGTHGRLSCGEKFTCPASELGVAISVEAKWNVIERKYQGGELDAKALMQRLIAICIRGRAELVRADKLPAVRGFRYDPRFGCVIKKRIATIR